MTRPERAAVLTDKTTAFSLTEQFVSSPRGARLARRLAVRCMAEWGYPPPSDASCTVALVVGELAANAVRHGRVPGRDFGLRLVLDAAEGLVRVEVADAVGEKRPPVAGPSPCPEGESGRGLLLVDALALRRGTVDRWPVGKTVWAEVAVSGSGDRPSSVPRTASPAGPAAGCPG
ncbi:ATP-binding protein [Streptomyces antibioticus]|uniref:ATP-binding protein n=1 Tax=Streptomyces antibioticus TaxID=1890 RepID=UPI0036D917E7